MCGIVGIYNRDREHSCSEERLLAMRDLQFHRGPDDQGIYLDGSVGMGHRRLSIIDLGSGHQPMMTPDGNLAVVFNGEIYNYMVLRSELEARGCVFRTHSDTEVLLHLYREHGEHGVSRLNGIFAFAIWEKKSRKLFLARDHMGIKPLYYYMGPRSFVFSSEVKSIFASGEVTARCNVDAVPEYFAFRQVAGERTLFQDIKTLLPGHCMTISDGVATVSQYWSPLGHAPRPARSLDDSVDELDALLTDAVSMQMMSDVPLGTFCSGGIDSSLVTALCARAAGRPIDTYSVGFHEAAYDETAYARMVSGQYATHHHELRLTNEEFAERLPKMVWHNDEPLNFPNSVLIHALSELAKRRVTVVLTGEGADELFAGYPRYHIPTLVARFQRLPRWVRSILATASGVAGDRRLRKLADQLERPMADVLMYNAATLEHERLCELWPEAGNRQFGYRMELLQKLGSEEGWLRRMSMLDQHTYLVSILNRQDKMSMAASVESRVPLLDYRIVEFANSLPDSHRQGQRQTKLILKRVAERYLPRDVIYRRKSGFGIPLSEWFRTNDGLGKLAQHELTDASFAELGGRVKASQLLDEHRSGKRDHGEFLWTMINFALWKKAFGIA
jgi:asparagine synthase (glutamine-hydrolysing)